MIGSYKRVFEEAEYSKILQDNSIDIEVLEIGILQLLNTYSYKGKQELFHGFALEDEDIYGIYDMYEGKLEVAFNYCLQKGWIKKLTQDDLLFEQQFYNEQVINVFIPYKINNLGLTCLGAELYNQVELKMDELCNRRPYEGIIKYIHDNKLYLYSYYEDILHKEVSERMNSLYWFKNRKVEELEITYFNSYKINSWCVRRFIKLDTGYGAEIHYKEFFEF